MNVTDETCQSQIECSVPLCNWSCQVMDLLSNVNLVFQFLPKISISIQSESKSFWQFSHKFHTFWFYFLTVQTSQPSCARSLHGVQHTFERLWDPSPQAWPCMSYSKLWCLWDFSLQFWHLYLCWSASRIIAVFPSQSGYWLVLLNEYIQETVDQWKILGRPHDLFFQCCPHLRHVLRLSCPSLCRQFTNKNNCSLWWRYRHSHLVTFSHPSSIRTFSNFFSPKSPSNGWP